jgi:ubiquinone/menaquinone biosynthesis C-methylase UbiE
MIKNNKKKTAKKAPKSAPVSELKLDIGCGTNKKEGFLGIDILKFDGVDVVLDVRKTPWPWKDNSVDEMHSSHFLEHLTADERCRFMNEAYRVLKPKAKMTIVVPHWASGRAFGDPTHQWPPISEFWFYYLDKKWREKEAPHTNSLLKCDFESTWGYSVHQLLTTRNQEFQQFAINFYKEAVQDIIATVIKR